jgi:hypothetical protein
MYPLTHEQRVSLFWTKVRKGAPDACWEWQGIRNDRGYGQFWCVEPRRKMYLAHRLALAWSMGVAGDALDGKQVLHSCDNRRCVNPAHLRVGTTLDNMRDRMAREGYRTVARGAAHGGAKLTEEAIRAIRALSAQGVSSRRVAKRFGIAKSTVLRVVRGQNWRHVET